MCQEELKIKEEVVFGEAVCSAMLLHTRKYLTNVGTVKQSQVTFSDDWLWVSSPSQKTKQEKQQRNKIKYIWIMHDVCYTHLTDHCLEVANISVNSGELFISKRDIAPPSFIPASVELASPLLSSKDLVRAHSGH